MRVSTTLAAALLASIVVDDAQAEVRVGLAAPLSGSVQWSGEQMYEGARRAVADLNARGGVLGEEVVLIAVDDACDRDQALAAANQLIEAGVVFVDGHYCSHASIAAAPLYEQAGIPMLACSTNPAITESGWSNVFRVCGRDDQQGIMAAEYLVERHPNDRIAILHDGQIFGQGVAETAKQELNRHGIQEIMFEAYEPGLSDYFDLVDRLAAIDAEVVYLAGYVQDAALIVLHVADLDAKLPLVSTDTIAGQDFFLIAGEAVEGTVFTFLPDPRLDPRAADVIAAFRAEQYEPVGVTLNSYTAVQLWAQAAEAAGSFEADRVIEALRRGTFDTVLGEVGFDEKGDAVGYGAYEWYVWRGETYVPMK